MQFTKAQGLGNDFVIVDLRGRTLTPSPLEADVARLLCDRRFGIGADGVLGIVEPTQAGACARMIIRNADGSEPEMCGNGIRCVAKWLHDRGMTQDVLAIETGAGVLDCAVQREGDGLVKTVSVEMGRPSLGALERALENTPVRVTEVSIGNPHAVVFVDESVDLSVMAKKIGPAVEHHPRYPARTNVEFARVKDGTVELVVWERGCGITLACGTGASATVAAAVATRRCQADREVEVRLPGGTLFIRVASDLTGVRMRGPCIEVFSGDVDPSKLR